ncbi:MAG: flagellar motor protein MotB [Acidimicrobiales bacterium]
MSSRLRHHHEEEGNSERWLLTYADMITLLLALFVVLFALSTINNKKFLELKLGLTKTFNQSPITSSGSNGLLQQTDLTSHPGISQDRSTVNAGHAAPIDASSSQSQSQSQSPSLAQISQQIDQALAQSNLSQYATTSVSTRAVTVQVLADKAFFAVDSANLGSVGDQVVDTIAGVIRADPNNVAVEGYTDNQPIYGGPYSSNWELSAARAADVVERLNAVDGLPMTRLQAIGYGQTHPIASNATPAGQAENRRIDVVILGAGRTGP